jgi:hypothetical protein
LSVKYLKIADLKVFSLPYFLNLTPPIFHT